MSLIILDIDFLLNELDKSFYTMPLMILLNILFLIVALRNRSAKKANTIFIIYGALFLVENIAGICISLFDKVLIKNDSFTTTIGAYSVLCFVQIEFIVFYSFFYYQFNNKRIQNKIAVTGKIYAAAAVLFTLYVSIFPFPLTIKNLTAYIYVTSSILILIPAFYYFYTLFLEPPTKNLLQEPSFWITTGIAFLHSLNIPLFLIEKYLLNKFIPVWYSMYSINYIAYCFLFILLIISLLCDKEYKSQKTVKHLSTSLP
ncbi:MAG TPA: hypothetical protein VF008_31430 [Niastella sp.]